jgi:hypothetical protein
MKNTLTEGEKMSCTTELKNDLVRVEYNAERKQIFMKDLVDQNNDPAEYTTTKRNLKKAMLAVVAQFTPETTHYDVSTIVRGFGIRTHYWCMMD